MYRQHHLFSGRLYTFITGNTFAGVASYLPCTGFSRIGDYFQKEDMPQEMLYKHDWSKDNSHEIEKDTQDSFHTYSARPRSDPP